MMDVKYIEPDSTLYNYFMWLYFPSELDKEYDLWT